MAEGSRWDRPAPPPPKTPGSETFAQPPASLATSPSLVAQADEEAADRLELRNAHIEKNCLGHYYIVGYLPGDIRVAGWLHERPLPIATEGENGSPA